MYQKLKIDPYSELENSEIVKLCRKYPGLVQNKYIKSRLDKIHEKYKKEIDIFYKKKFNLI
jgi:hypothetical protein